MNITASINIPLTEYRRLKQSERDLKDIQLKKEESGEKMKGDGQERSHKNEECSGIGISLPLPAKDTREKELPFSSQTAVLEMDDPIMSDDIEKKESKDKIFNPVTVLSTGELPENNDTNVADPNEIQPWYYIGPP